MTRCLWRTCPEQARSGALPAGWLQLQDGSALCPEHAARLRSEAGRRIAAGRGGTSTRRCDQCGAEYTARSPRSRFCSGRCRMAAFTTRKLAAERATAKEE